MCCSSAHENKPQTSITMINSSWGDQGWCECAGTDGTGCCGKATQPDGLCDRCRTHCRKSEDDGIKSELGEAMAEALGAIPSPVPSEERELVAA